MPALDPADELAIRNVVALLALRADDGEIADYVALFTPDAAWEMPGAGRHGHDDIRAGAEERRAEGVTGPGSGTRHLITTLAVAPDGDDDHAVADSYWLFLGSTDTAPVVRGVGTYRDRFVRMGDGWKVARREISFG